MYYSKGNNILVPSSSIATIQYCNCTILCKKTGDRYWWLYCMLYGVMIVSGVTTWIWIATCSCTEDFLGHDNKCKISNILRSWYCGIWHTIIHWIWWAMYCKAIGYLNEQDKTHVYNNIKVVNATRWCLQNWTHWWHYYTVLYVVLNKYYECLLIPITPSICKTLCWFTLPVGNWEIWTSNSQGKAFSAATLVNYNWLR